MKHVFLFWVLCLAVPATAFAYDMPLGIPDPGFGLDEAKPARPSPWLSGITGYYYVENTSGCDDAREFGYPGSPRCSIPDPVPAGSYVEIHGTYGLKTAGAVMIHGQGTADAPVWVVGQDENQMPTFTDITMIRGSYVYLEHVRGFFTGATDCFRIGSGSKPGFKGDHIMIRNSVAEGDGLTLTHGFSVMGYSEAEAAEHILLVHNEVKNHGALNASVDLDAHAITVNRWARQVWVLDNTVHTIGGSGIAFGQEGPNPTYTDIQWLYAGRNTVYDTTQAAIGVKDSWHVVLSENIAHDQITRWVGGVVGTTVASPSKCFGWKGEPQDLWIINNTCSNNSYGVHGGSTVDGDWHIYVIGNVFHDIYAQKPDQYNGANAWSEAAISLVGGNHVYAINNTVYNSVSGIMTPGSGAHNKYYFIENNIVSTISHPTGSHINSENSANETVLRNNILYQPGGGEMIRWRSAGEYRLEEFQAATGKGQGCMNTDPLFVSSDDFHLQASSPARNNGLADTDLSLDVYARFTSIYGLDIRKDLDRLTRPAGEGWDMGAYEFREDNRGTGGGGIPSGDRQKRSAFPVGILLLL